MWKTLKKLVGLDRPELPEQPPSQPNTPRPGPPPRPKAIDPVVAVDAALAIQSTEDIGSATSALDAGGAQLVGEVVKRVEEAQLRPAPKMAAAIWLAHHVTDECQPALDEALVETLLEALNRDVFGILLPAAIDAVAKLPVARRDAIAAKAFAQAGRSDQKFRLVKISRTDAMLEVVNQALGDLEELRIALAEAAFRTSFQAEDAELLLRHHPADAAFASAYIVAFAAIGDERFVPALVAALDSNYTRVRDAARRGLQKMQDVAEDAVLTELGASRKGQRLGAAAVLEKWDINDRVRVAIQAALANEKVAEVREALLPLAPLEGEVNFRTMNDLYDKMPEERRKRMGASVQARLGGTAVDWSEHAAHPDELLAVLARDLAGAPTGIDHCIVVLGEVLAVASGADLAPWASAWFARSIRSLYSKGRPLPWDEWKAMHVALGDRGLQPLVDLLLEHQFEGSSTVRWFAIAQYAPSEQHARLLAHDNRDDRLDAARAMANAQPGMVPFVTPMLQDARKETREAAAAALQAIGDPSAEDALQARLKSERAKDARQAIEAALTALKLAALAEEGGAIDELEPTAENHAKLDERLAAIGSKPKFDMSTLPPVRWSSGAELSDGAYRWFVSTLETNDFGMPDADLEAIAAHVLDVDRKRLLDALHAGFDPEHREVRIGWVLFSTALLGNEDQIMSLGAGLDEMARFASSEQAFRRIEVLEHHGSNAAIGWLDHWARKAKSAGLKERSRAALRRLADERGVSAEDLADLVFGDFGLDERGVRVFTVGGREIPTKFDNTGEVGVLKEDGSLVTRFPSELKDDDSAEYERVRDEYRAWRKALKRALKGQIDRLEWSMIWGRTWERETLLENYGKHPVLRELACSILWLAEAGDRRAVVRLDRDLTFSTVDEEPFDGIERLSVAHPAEISAADVGAWHELFVDYMLIAPFPQLDRPRAAIPEPSGNELRFEDVDSEPMRARLLNAGWQRGMVEDGGMVFELDRLYPNGLVSIAQLDPGMYVARDTFSGSQNVTVSFLRDHATVPLADVPRCLLAEVCWEVAG